MQKKRSCQTPLAIGVLMGALTLSVYVHASSLAFPEKPATPIPGASPPTSSVAKQVTAEVVAEGLEHPWAVAFLPDGRYLVTERPGRMRLITANGRLEAPLQGLPDIYVSGQGGLLDVVLDSDFASNRTLYFCYSEAGQGNDRGKNSTALASAKLSTDGTRLEEVKTIFSQKPKYDSALHFGCRIVEGISNGKPDGTLFLSLGERSKFKEEAQNLKSHLGKIVRIGKDGSIPSDNPFIGRSDALPEIWSWGHRSPQGAAMSPDGTLWMHEHGPQGGDEINRPEKGKNYGWPIITYGENYGGGKIGSGITRKEGLEQPVHVWVPSIAPSGMAFVTSKNYGEDWKGSLLVGALKAQRLERLHWKDGRLNSFEQILPNLGHRVRDVRQGIDGWIYFLTDAPDGKLFRLAVKK